MKALIFSTLLFGLACSALAQTPDVTYTAAQLDQLVAPIALYPDPLVALILPAATVPADLAEAADYLSVTGDPLGIDSQPWDPSVKGLAHYPDVLRWMYDNLAWTEALGAAFLQQPADVMKSIQQLRAEALAAGTLVNTPQQQVDVEGDDIRIIPTQEDMIYVPTYDPSVVYTPPPPDISGPYLSFGPGYPVGGWLTFQCDWDGFGIWIGPWAPGWAYRREWRQAGFEDRGWRTWRPDPHRSYEAVHNAYRPENRLPSPGIVTRNRQPEGTRPFGGIESVAIPPGRGGPRATVTVSPPAPDNHGRGLGAPATVGEAPVVVGPAGSPRPTPGFSTGARDRETNVTSSSPPAPINTGERSRGTAAVPPAERTPPPINTGERSRGTTATPAPSSPVFGGYSRGTDARDSSNRGQASRAEPVRAPPPEPVAHSAPAPAPARAPAAGSGDDNKNRH